MSNEAIEVFVTSLEAAEDQVAELWIDGVQFGQTILQGERVMLHIEPRPDGTAWEVDAHELRRGLARAADLLAGR